MDIIDYLITNISELPWNVKGPGLVLIAYFSFRAFTQFLTLRWIRAATTLVYALIVALGMARFGSDIANLITEKQTVPVENIQQD